METILVYCTECGQQVTPYQPSTTTYYESGEQTQPGGVDRYYWCPRCNRERVATNLIETGWDCGHCGAFMPMAVRFCGACGQPMGSCGETN